MDQHLINIKKLVSEGDVKTALSLLDEYLNANPADDEAFFLRGNAFSKIGDWQNAINNYCEASSLNPNSPATEACKQINEILNFYNHDLYNP